MKKRLSNEAYHNEKTVLSNGKRQRHRVEVIAMGPNNTILATSIKNHPNGYVELPGGGMDKDESIIQAAIREVAEEAGWIVNNIAILNVNTDCIVSSTVNPWLKENGYDEERHFAVMCNAVKFQPTEKYGSEDDSHNYQLIPIHQVIEETKQTMLNSQVPHGRFICKFRLAALSQIFNVNNVKVESLQPTYAKW